MTTHGVRFDGDSEIVAALAAAIEGRAFATSRPIVCHVWSDVSIGDIAALDAADECAVVVVGEIPSPYVSRALLRVAHGVILAEDAETTLVPTLEAVCAGLRVYPDQIARNLREPVLSSREKQMLAMVALDFSNAEIARKLHVSESNVKFHLSSAFNKLGVRSRSAAAAMILDPNTGLGLGILRITGPSEDQL